MSENENKEQDGWLSAGCGERVLLLAELHSGPEVGGGGRVAARDQAASADKWPARSCCAAAAPFRSIWRRLTGSLAGDNNNYNNNNRQQH